MIIITEEKDITGNLVIDWLLFYKSKVTIFNSNMINVIYSFSINNAGISIELDKLKFNKKAKIWHRRGRFNFSFRTQHQDLNKYLKTDENVILKSMEAELNKLTNYVGSYIKEAENNKLNILLSAKKTGFNIPNTLITSSKKELQKYFDRYKNVITKDLHHPVWFKIENTQYSSVGTIKVTQKMIDKCNDYFIPMFLQEMVEKNMKYVFFIIKINFTQWQYFRKMIQKQP